MKGDVSFFESPDGAIGGCVMEDFCIAVVLEVGDCSVVVEELVEVFGGGSFCKVSGSDEDEFSFVFKMEDGFVDKKQIEVCSVVETGFWVSRVLEGEYFLDFFMCCGGNILEADIGGISDDGIEFFGEGIIEEVHVMVDMIIAGVVAGEIVVRIERWVDFYGCYGEGLSYGGIEEGVVSAGGF